MYFTGKDYEKVYTDIVTKYNSVGSSEYNVLFYLLTATDNLREHFDDCYDPQSGFIKTDALDRGWATSTDGKLIRLAFNLFNGGVPTAHKYRSKGNEEQLIHELEYCSPFSLFVGLDDSNFDAAIEALRLWRNRSSRTSRIWHTQL